MKHVFALLLAFISLQVSATDYYFSNAGNNSNPGTALSPFQSAAKISALSLQPGDKLRFNGGDVFFGTWPTLPSGANGNDIIIESYGNGRAFISGFVNIPTWTNQGGNIWTASVGAGSSLNMVTLNGSLVPPGRFPNTGWLTMGVTGSETLNGQQTNQTTFTTTTPSPSVFASGGILADVVIKKREWIIDKCPVSSISGQTVNFTNVNQFPAVDTWGAFFTNHPATLDVQNEWYYGNGTLRMYSLTNPASLNVRAATQESLINLQGKSYIRFQNINFEGVKGHLFNVSGGTGVRILNCDLKFANRAVNADFATGLTVDHCNISFINNSGIDAVLGTNQTITSNFITYCGMNQALMGPGNKANHAMFINGTGTTIKYNDISYIGYVGIDFGGNNVLVENNNVHHYCLKATDGGGIYTSDEKNAFGRIIRGNVVTYGIGAVDGTPFTINDNAYSYYFDEASVGILLENNFSAYCAGGGVYFHRASKCIARGNVIRANLQGAKWAEDGIGTEKITEITFTGNFIYSESEADKIYTLYAQTDVNNFFTEINNNVLSRPSNPNNIIHEIINYYQGGEAYSSLSQWKTRGFDVNSTSVASGFTGSTPIVQINGSAVPLVIQLDGVYKSIKGVTFSNGTAEIAPYSGEILSKIGEFPVIKTVKIKTRVNIINFSN